MLKKILLAVSFLLPLAALTAPAQAGSTISDKNYWPSEARRSAQYAAPSQDRLNSAFAYDQGISAVQPGPSAYGRSPAGRYQGGPKSH
jgi:hypothetical protein